MAGQWTGATCPVCAAPAGQPCQTVFGSIAVRSHAERMTEEPLPPVPAGRGSHRPAEVPGEWFSEYPRQLAHVTLRELTPELRAHYACPADIDCGHPECQP